MISLKLARWIVLVALSTLLGGCINFQDENDPVRDYEASVRSEADWLWNNMNYVRIHLKPDPVYCATEVFDHDPVILSPQQRERDPRAAALVDRLDYAAVLIQQAHDEWDRFCRSESSAVNTAAALERRLLPAYQSMNQVRVALLPSQATPQPGST